MRRDRLVFEDSPDSDYSRDRRDPNDDVIWEEALPMYDLECDGDMPLPFHADTLLGIIVRNVDAFRSLLGGEERISSGLENDFLVEFYCY